MTVKLFEIRDRATCIPAMAIHLRNRTPAEFALLRHAGYSAAAIGGPEKDAEPYVLLVMLDGCRAQYDPYGWDTGARTMVVAHAHLIAHWDELSSGDVIDVRFLLKETTALASSDVQPVTP